MTVLLDAGFRATLPTLSARQRQQVTTALRRLHENPHYPSLRLKRLESGDVWTVRLDHMYRLVLRLEPSGAFVVLGIAHHDTLNARGKRSVARW